MTTPTVKLLDVPILRSHYYNASKDGITWTPYTEWWSIPVNTLDCEFRFRFRHDARTVEGRLRLDREVRRGFLDDRNW